MARLLFGPSAQLRAHNNTSSSQTVFHGDTLIGTLHCSIEFIIHQESLWYRSQLNTKNSATSHTHFLAVRKPCFRILCFEFLWNMLCILFMTLYFEEQETAKEGSNEVDVINNKLICNVTWDRESIVSYVSLRKSRFKIPYSGHVALYSLLSSFKRNRCLNIVCEPTLYWENK